MKRTVTIYTDGGCDPNPGPGGYGAVLLEDGVPSRELWGGEPETTNNRMEMTAAVEALKALPEGCRVHLWTDSQYLKNGITKWLADWRARGWVTKSKEPVKNQDLWEALDLEISKHEVSWHWTRGHSGNRWNEHADMLATRGTSEARRTKRSFRKGSSVDDTGGTTLAAMASPSSPGDAGEPDPEPIASPSPAKEDADGIHIYTGISFSGGTKRGAIAVRMRFRGIEKTFTRGYAAESANPIHLHSAIDALKALKRPSKVHLYTVSDYVVLGVTQWIKGWRARGWVTKGEGAVKNRRLWEELDQLSKQHEIHWHVVGKDAEVPPDLLQMKQLAHDSRSDEPAPSP